MGLAWWIGEMAGRVAGLLRDALLMCNVAQVRAAVARSQRRGRVAIVIADNRKRAHARWLPAGAQHAYRIERAPVSRLYPCL
jgi:hypothetical protein